MTELQDITDMYVATQLDKELAEMVKDTDYTVWLQELDENVGDEAGRFTRSI